jgi:hypothetical protein
MVGSPISQRTRTKGLTARKDEQFFKWQNVMKYIIIGLIVIVMVFWLFLEDIRRYYKK